ncbi:MAG: CHAT domain-containing protein [Bdellovibrionales bacterium]|nr:CHAT domain-containing protein [Bdellovibrionales bacterium]
MKKFTASQNACLFIVFLLGIFGYGVAADSPLAVTKKVSLQFSVGTGGKAYTVKKAKSKTSSKKAKRVKKKVRKTEKLKNGGDLTLTIVPNKGKRPGIFVDGKFLAASKDDKPWKHKLKKIRDNASIEIRFINADASFTEVLNMVFFGLGAQEFITTEETPTLSIQGESDDDIPVLQIKWINRSNGTSGNATKIGDSWQIQPPLTTGDNDFIFTMTAADWSEETQEMIIVRHSQEMYAYPLEVSDEIMFTNATEDDKKLRFHVGLLGTASNISVSLERVNEKGFYIGPQYSLADDGTLPDEISKDGVYTADIEIPLTGGEGYLYYRANVSTEMGSFKSQILRIWVTSPLTDSDVNTVVAVSNKAKSLYDEAVAAGTSALQAVTDTAALLSAEDGVAKAGANSSTGIWAITTRGLLAGYNPVIAGKKGGAVSPPQAPTKSGVHALAAAEDDNSIFSRRGLIISPYINHPNASADRNFSTSDDLYGPWSVLPSSSEECELAASKQIVNNGTATVTLDNFKNVGEYGVIHISSHGDNLFYNLIRSWQDAWGPKDLFRGSISKVVLDSGVQMLQEDDSSWDFAAIEKDLLLKRIALGPDSTFYLLPSFFDKYLEDLPNSLVVLSSCRSMKNRSLADAFLAKGAGAVLGFSDYVSQSYAQSFITQVYSQMMSGADAQSAFNTASNAVGANDGTASAVMIGDSPSTLLFPFGARIFNGGFERGFTPWVRDGDGRRLGRLGETGPVSGSYVGIISTGLGYSESSGAMYQEICVDENAQQLNFWWNFFSEEFLEFCGSQFQDTFDVAICTGEIGSNSENCTSLLHYKIDDLCDLHEKGQIPLTESDVHFDKGGAYYTGWQQSSLSLQAYQGQLVTIKFASGDVGDSIYDTAILLDDIEQK